MNLRANLVFALLLAPLGIGAQEAKPLPSADERYKADILLVVAHPDDEGGATPYLARAIYDEHKRVAVVFATRAAAAGMTIRASMVRRWRISASKRRGGHARGWESRMCGFLMGRILLRRTC